MKTEAKQKQRWIDVYLGRYKWYRKIVGGIWYKHQFTRDALQLSVTFNGSWWARYAQLNRYSKVVEVETYGGGEQFMNETKLHHIMMYITFFCLGVIMSGIMVSQGLYQEMIYVMLAGIIFLFISLAYNYVRGIDYMNENHPDYKGEDLFGEDEWDHYSDLPNPKAYEKNQK